MHSVWNVGRFPRYFVCRVERSTNSIERMAIRHCDENLHLCTPSHVVQYIRMCICTHTCMDKNTEKRSLCGIPRANIVQRHIACYDLSFHTAVQS